jgi:hypothetical protein
VGVELGSWLDQEQMGLRRRRERIEADILAAIGEQPENSTQHFRFVLLHPKDTVRMHELNPIRFREELLALIAQVDCEKPANRRFESSEIIEPSQTSYPTVAKALRSIQFFRRREGDNPAPGIPWIIFRTWNGQHPRSMVTTLQKRLSEKCKKYRKNDGLKSFSEFVLVVHYDQALLYNSPVYTPDGFKDVIAEARISLGGNPGAFTRIFVLIAVEPGARVLRLYP